MSFQKVLFFLVSLLFCALLYLNVESNYAAISRIWAPLLYCSRLGVKLSEAQVDFLRSGLSRRYHLFVIQPSLLIKCVDSDDLTALVNNKLLPISATNYSGDVLSLGYVPKNNLQDVCSSLVEHNLTKWKCTSHPVREPFEGNDFDDALISSLIGHYIFTNGNNLVHVSVFHERENYLWVDQLRDQDTEKFTFGQHSRHLYDPFQVMTAYVDLDHGQLLPIKVPSEAWYFLSQVDTSTFVPCNHKMAAKWTGGRASDTFLRQGEGAIVAMKKLTKQLRMNFWLDSGTLLGWYRQCDVIPYTHDFDFATWARYIQSKDGAAFRSYVAAELKGLNSGLELWVTYGHPAEAFEIGFKRNGLKVDLFFAYETEKYHQTGGHVIINNTYFYYQYPKWTLCSAILLGQKVLVHCDSESTLRSAYGDHFSEPVKTFHWAIDAFNMGPLHTWPPGVEGSHWF
ncbi:Fukutin [Halotydeus destructor]|nr:Fukutin [Halotydeus destructor]